jgi:hypothetical protein
MNTFSCLAEACIDVAILGFPEEPGTTEILELLERSADVAERFIFLVLLGELREFKVNITGTVLLRTYPVSLCHLHPWGAR